jgi:hypothetical protein
MVNTPVKDIACLGRNLVSGLAHNKQLSKLVIPGYRHNSYYSDLLALSAGRSI